MNTTVRSESQPSLFADLLNFIGVSLLAGLSSSIILAIIVLLLSSAG